MLTGHLAQVVGLVANGTLGVLAPDYLQVVRRYFWTHGKFRVFLFPRTYSQLLKRKILFDRDPVLTETADKYRVRDYIARRIGAGHVIPLLGAYDDPQTIPLEDLPRPFVLKATHGSGFNIFIREAADIDRAKIVGQLTDWLATDFHELDREWAYKDIRRRIIAEKMLLQDGKPPLDYKFFVFNGKVRMISVVVGWNPRPQVVRLDENWRALIANNISQDNITTPLERPGQLTEMIRIAEFLGTEFSHVRVDLYDVDDTVYFGEMTHYPLAGSSPFHPREFDRVLGDLWRKNRPIPEAYYVDRQHR
jgi:hypothetical protein